MDKLLSRAVVPLVTNKEYGGLQGTVQVCDAASPPRCESRLATLALEVIRNLGVPQFLSAPSSVSMDGLQVGTPVATVTATDPDASVSTKSSLSTSVMMQSQILPSHSLNSQPTIY